MQLVRNQKARVFLVPRVSCEGQSGSYSEVTWNLFFQSYTLGAGFFVLNWMIAKSCHQYMLVVLRVSLSCIDVVSKTEAMEGGG